MLLVFVLAIPTIVLQPGAERTWAPGDPESERPLWMNREGGPQHSNRALLGPPSVPSPPDLSVTRVYQAPVAPPLFPFTGAELAAFEEAASTIPSPFNYTWEAGFLAAGGTYIHGA